MEETLKISQDHPKNKLKINGKVKSLCIDPTFVWYSPGSDSTGRAMTDSISLNLYLYLRLIGL